MALKSTTVNPPPIFIRDEMYVTHYNFPPPLNALTPAQVSHRWGRNNGQNQGFPKPVLIGGFRYYKMAALLEYIEASAQPERYSLEALLKGKGKGK